MGKPLIMWGQYFLQLLCLWKQCPASFKNNNRKRQRVTFHYWPGSPLRLRACFLSLCPSLPLVFLGPPSPPRCPGAETGSLLGSQWAGGESGGRKKGHEVIRLYGSTGTVWFRSCRQPCTICFPVWQAICIPLHRTDLNPTALNWMASLVCSGFSLTPHIVGSGGRPTRHFWNL